MNIWLSSLRIRAHLSWRTGKHLHVLHVLLTSSTCSYPGYQDTTTYAALCDDSDHSHDDLIIAMITMIIIITFSFTPTTSALSSFSSSLLLITRPEYFGTLMSNVYSRYYEIFCHIIVKYFFMLL